MALDPLITELALAGLAGILAGIVSGLFGVGGGVVAVPAAIWISGLDFHGAKAASLLVVIFGSTVALYRHHQGEKVLWREGLLLVAGGIPGAILSSLIARDVSETVLGQAFGVLLLLVAVRMLVGQPGQRLDRKAWMLPALGFLAGTLTGFFGVGGGVIMVPGLSLLGFPIHHAVATSLVGVVGNGSLAAITQASDQWQAMVRVGIPLAIGAMLGGRLGARLALGAPAKVLRRAFAVFLALVGLRFLL
ncbi:MAG: sulfite exporter TauE/SafE family protein [Candidatus Thermoplasmatota archaeon]|nr:sulfite exporter TauE/SafE family protein [Candidatus Thermoplasmatota archaeon]